MVWVFVAFILVWCLLRWLFFDCLFFGFPFWLFCFIAALILSFITRIAYMFALFMFNWFVIGCFCLLWVRVLFRFPATCGWCFLLLVVIVILLVCSYVLLVS